MEGASNFARASEIERIKGMWSNYDKLCTVSLQPFTNVLSGIYSTWEFTIYWAGWQWNTIMIIVLLTLLNFIKFFSVFVMSTCFLVHLLLRICLINALPIRKAYQKSFYLRENLFILLTLLIFLKSQWFLVSKLLSFKNHKKVIIVFSIFVYARKDKWNNI